MKTKHRWIFIVLIILLSASTFLHANSARISALGLVLGESDWMVKDPGNIYYNPAYMHSYNGLIEANTLDKLGDDKPFGSAFVKVNSILNLGITVGYPLYNSSELNVFRSGKPSDNINNLYLRTVNTSILDYSTLLTPATTMVYNALATAPFDIQDDLTINKLMLHFGANFKSIKLGLTIRYTGEGFEDHETITDLITPGNTTTTAKAGKNSELGIIFGAIVEDVAFINELAFDLGMTFPSFLRKDQTTSAGNAILDIREMSSDGAYVFSAGVNMTINTSKKNDLLFRFVYSIEDYSIKHTEMLDNDGNGSYFDFGDINITDNYGRSYNTLIIGIANRVKVGGIGFIYGGAYYKLVKHNISASGSRADTIQNGPNYTTPVEASITENILPVIVGGEFNIADWIVARFSVLKEFFKSRKEINTLRNYTAGTSDLTSIVESTDSFDYQGDTSLNIGMTIRVGNFSIDWVINKRWISDGGLLSSSGVTADFDNLSTQFSISWKFGDNKAN